MFNKKIIKKQLARDFDALLLLPCALERAAANKWLQQNGFSEGFTFFSSGRGCSGVHVDRTDRTTGWDRENS